jgi:serine/threonine protein kinase/tetratricopeptide (TPR) repeat protein
MPEHQTVLWSEDELDRRVAAYEAAWGANGSADLDRFLPPRPSPLYPRVLSELIRIDLEFRRSRGESPRLESYRVCAPDLFADPGWIRDLAFEEYRQRRAGGDRVGREEYGDRYRIDVTDWPEPDPPGATTDPKPGETIGPFRIVSELGRGAFARVYLAEQTDLAGRKVALKLSTRFGVAEPDVLARLQHTHIVPIYSVERHGRTQAIVMPYLGSTTLADVLAALKARHAWPQSGRALADTIVDRAGRTATGDPPAAPVERPAATLPLEELRKLSYCDAVLWLGWKLADALAHAHARGVLHRDVKPANVLLTDDGQPMLLDFNLAADAGSPADAGGTPAYMAPEQRAALGTGRTPPDPRSDLYSLGLVLAELLTGSVPKAEPGSPPYLRDRNPQVTPSVEAILRKCLAFDPADRYRSARELADELHRQITHQPLAATREPSPRERLRKWKRRHPLLASNGTVAAASLACLLALGAGLVARQRHVTALLEERAAAEKFAAFQAAAVPAYERLVLRDAGADTSEADRLLARYGVAGNDAWAEDGSVARLPEAGRRDLVEQVAELLLLKARLEPDRAAAIRLNQQAADALRRWRPVPRSVWQDRAAFARALGREADARAWEEEGRTAPAEGRDLYLSGLARRDAGRFDDAARLFERAVEADPRHYWSWLLLGDVRTLLGRDDLAEGCFDACVALQPTYLSAYHNRALCRHRLRRYDGALSDFTRALDLEPSNGRIMIARGITLQTLGRWDEAGADFTRAIEGGTTETRVHQLRSEVRAAAGDAAGAERDRNEGLRLTPSDEVSWVTRALAKSAGGDAAGALADLEQALRINPHSYAALMNRANILDEKLHREADAVGALDRLVDAYPHALAARSGRAVLLARLGRRAEALADAAYCRAHGPEPFVRYQLAGAYALLSRDRPAEAGVALELLRSALRDGTGHELLLTDPDLGPIRTRREFLELAEAARVLSPSNRN